MHKYKQDIPHQFRSEGGFIPKLPSLKKKEPDNHCFFCVEPLP